ncbi:MAG: alpha/beta fold hydrolase [Lentisphaeria bacterium]
MSDVATAPWRALYPYASHYVALPGGQRLHYLDEGRGPAVVLVHGNPTWSFFFRDLVRELRDAGFRVIAPDHLGCGLSDKPQDWDYRLAGHIANLEFLLWEHLRLESCDFVVHDWGGAIGGGVAGRAPARVRRWVAMNTAAFRLPRCPWRIRVCRTPVLGALAVRGGNAFARAAVRMATTRPGGLPPAVRAGYLAPYDSWANRIATLRFVQDIPLSPRHPTRATLEAVEQNLPRLADKPLLLLWGMRDFCFTPAFLAEWRRRFPAATVVEFPDAGHYLLEDAGDQAIRRIREFLAAPV